MAKLQLQYHKRSVLKPPLPPTASENLTGAGGKKSDDHSMKNENKHGQRTTQIY